jgi:hypothetical protein
MLVKIKCFQAKIEAEMRNNHARMEANMDCHHEESMVKVKAGEEKNCSR